VKITEYFKHIRIRPDRSMIRDEWIELTIQEYEARQVQSDGRIRLWKRIPAAEGQWLRVVLMNDG
jgi:hypothetical protein